MSVIKNARLKFNRPRKKLNKVNKIIIHHPVADWTVKRTHDYFINKQGYNGIAYNYYIQKDGQGFYGRSDPNQEYEGAHTSGRNDDTLGVSFEGNFQVDQMSAKQLQMGIKVVSELCIKHKLTSNDLLPHSAVGNTVCPGKNFPMVALMDGVNKELNEVKLKPVKLYKVQVGAFANKDNAYRLEKELKKKGYSTYIIEETKMFTI